MKEGGRERGHWIFSCILGAALEVWTAPATYLAGALLPFHEQVSLT